MPELFKIRTNGGVPFTVGKDYAPQFTGLLNDLEGRGYAIKPEQSGGYNYRNIAGTNTLSHHATGQAVDVNWDQNARGTAGNIDPAVARELAQKYGMTWGGDWKNPDPMHFEIGGTPTRVADATGSIPQAPTSEPAVMNDAGPQPILPKQGPGMGGLLDGLENAVASPLFQFGAGMAGAGSKGLGIGGGFAEGAQSAGKGYEYAKQKRELDAMSQRDAFMKSLSDPGNPIAAGFSPETVAALKGLPPDQSAALLAQMLSRKGDTAQAAAIAKINADAHVAGKNAEFKFARDAELENTQRMLKMFAPDMNPAQSAPQAPSQGAPQAPPVPGARKAADGKFYVPDPNRPGKYLMVQP